MIETYQVLEIVTEVANKANTTSDIFWNIMGAILTVIPAVISLFTLFEMKTQRNRAYQPDIVFSNLRLYVDIGVTEIEGEKIEDIKFAFIPAGENWDICNSTKTVTLKISDFGRREICLAIPACNTGASVCKNLRCTYSLDSYKEWLETLFEHNIIKWENTNRDAWVSCNAESQIGPFVISGESTVVSETFLVPNSKEEYKIKLPYEYYYFLMSIQNLDDFYKIENTGLPKIKVLLEYKDVQGKTYKRSAFIEIKPFSPTVSSGNSLVFIYDVSVE